MTAPSRTEQVLQLPLLFKGRRILVVDNRVGNPFDVDEDVVCWDRVLACDFCFAKFLPDGTLKGWIAYGMHALTVTGADPRDLAFEALRTLKWTLDH